MLANKQLIGKLFFLMLYLEALGYTLYSFFPKLITDYIFLRQNIYGLHIANGIMFILLVICLTLQYNPIVALFNLFGFIAIGELIFNTFYLGYYWNNVYYIIQHKPLDALVFFGLLLSLLTLTYILAIKRVLIKKLFLIYSSFWIVYLLVWVFLFDFRITLFIDIGQTKFYNDFLTNLLEILYYHMPIIFTWIYYIRDSVLKILRI